MGTQTLGDKGRVQKVIGQIQMRVRTPDGGEWDVNGKRLTRGDSEQELCDDVGQRLSVVG